MNDNRSIISTKSPVGADGLFAPKAAYLFVLLLLATNCWNIKFLFPILDGIPGLILYLLWLFVGVVIWGRNASRSFFNIKTNLPVVLTLAGIVLSFISANLYYGQTILTSFFACRVAFIYLTLPVLLIVRPRASSIRSALLLFSAVFLIVFVVDTYLGLEIVARSEKEKMMLVKDVSYIDGIQFVAMSLFFALPRAFKRPNLKNIAVVSILFVCILIFRNRTTLFAVLILIVWYIFRLPNTRQSLRVKMAVLLLSALILVVSRDLISSLMEETTGDLTNDNYNRNVALAYFLFEAPQGLLSYILGNGFLSAHTTSLMQDMMEFGVYNSDVGFLGMWNQFGIIPVITVIVTCLQAFFCHSSSILKFNGAFILLCGASAAYFFQPSKILWVCLFWYLFAVERIKR